MAHLRRRAPLALVPLLILAACTSPTSGDDDIADRSTGEPVTADTVFSIGSVSRAFTAALVLDLVDRDRLALDERAGDVVPGLTGPAAGATVGQLLPHTSGLTGQHGADHRPLDHDEPPAGHG